MTSLVQFPFPEIENKNPKWDGERFRVGDETRPFLCYGGFKSNWSSELTALHEKEGGDGNHPIDILSRFYAESSLERVIKTKGTLLDVGCSSDYFLKQILLKHPECRLIGSDYLPGIVAQCAKNMPHVPMLQFDLRDCPLLDNCLDGVVALNVLEHIDDDKKALRQIFRILKPGGIAHIEVPANPNLYDFYDEVLLHYRRYQRKKLIGECERTGFHIIRAFGVGWIIYPMFYVFKIRNRILCKRLSDVEKKCRVALAIRKTRASQIVTILLRMELMIGKWIGFPFGIRHSVVLKKP